MAKMTLPDGRVIKVPDGLAPEQVQAIVGAASAPQTPAQPLGPPAELQGPASVFATNKPPDPAPDVTQQRNKALGRGLADTMGMGYADEIAAGIAALDEHFLGGGLPIGDAYNQAVTQLRAQSAQSAEEHPWDYHGGQGAGVAASLLTPAPYINAAKGAGAIAKTTNAVVDGAVMGGVYGFGAGENGVENRLESAGRDALIGGGLGAALRAAAAPLKGIHWLSKTITETPTEFAARKVTRAAERGGKSPQEVLSSLKTDRQVSPELMLVDALGTPGARQARALMNSGDEGGEKILTALYNRQIAQGERVQSAMAKNVGDPSTYHGSMEDATRALKENAAPYYEEARGTPIDYSVYTRLVELLNNVPPPAIYEANKIIGVTGNKSRQILLKEGADGAVAQESLPDVEQWDYIKQGLDTIINGAEGKGVAGGQTPYGSAVIGLKKEILSELDQAVPAYGKARSVFSDDLAVKRALEDGREAFRADPEHITKIMGEMDSAAQKAYRIGAARAAADQVDKGGMTQDALRRIWNSPAQQKRWKAILGEGADFEQFAKLMENEAKMSHTFNRARGNSTTAEQINDLEDIGQGVFADTLGRAATRGPWNAALNLTNRLSSRLGGLSKSRGAKLADVLTSDGSDIEKILADQAMSAETLATFERMLETFGARTGTAAIDAKTRKPAAK